MDFPTPHKKWPSFAVLRVPADVFAALFEADQRSPVGHHDMTMILWQSSIFTFTPLNAQNPSWLKNASAKAIFNSTSTHSSGQPSFRPAPAMAALQHLRWARFLQLPGHEGVEEDVELRGPKVAGRGCGIPTIPPWESLATNQYSYGMKQFLSWLKCFPEFCPPVSSVLRLHFAGSTPTLRHWLTGLHVATWQW